MMLIMLKNIGFRYDLKESKRGQFWVHRVRLGAARAGSTRAQGWSSEGPKWVKCWVRS